MRWARSARWAGWARWLALSAVALPTSLTPQTSQPLKTVESVLARAEAAYRSWSTFRAEFLQTITNPMLGAPEVSRGVVFLAPPNRFAMRFTEPPGDRMVADGQWLWIYAPSSVEGQVIRQPIPQDGPLTPNLVAQFVDRPLERYDATYLRADSVGGRTVDVVQLAPRDPAHAPFRRAEISVDREDGLLRRLIVVETTGQRRDIIFRSIRPDSAIPDEEFRFTVPPGVRIVTP